MTKLTQYSGTLAAYITNTWTTPATIAKSEFPIEEMYYASPDMNIDAWIKVGTVELTVTMLPDSTVVAGMVDAIDEQIKKTYAEAESKINLLKEKKQSLLAITMESSSS